jgi:hypothetical protein
MYNVIIRFLSVCERRSNKVSKQSIDIEGLTLSDPMSDLVRHYDFPVPDAFLDL